MKINKSAIPIVISLAMISNLSLAANFYMQSLVYDNRSFNMITDNANGIVHIKTVDGPGSVYFKIFSAQCNTSNYLSHRQSYYIVPNRMLVNTFSVDVKWTAQQQIIPIDNDFTLLMGTLVTTPLACATGGSGYSTGGSGRASGLIKVPPTLPPGTYKSPGFTYYFGEILGDTPSSFVSTILSYYKSGDKITVTKGSYDDITIPLSCTTNQSQINLDFGDVNINTSKSSEPLLVSVLCNSFNAARDLTVNLISAGATSPSNSILLNNSLNIKPSKGVDISLNASKTLSGENNAFITLTSKITVGNAVTPGYIKTNAILQLQFP